MKRFDLHFHKCEICNEPLYGSKTKTKCMSCLTKHFKEKYSKDKYNDNFTSM